MAAAVFVDRDGTIIVDKHYLADADGVELLANSGEGLRAIQDQGFCLVLVTNQSGVGRGWFDTDTVAAQHVRLRELLVPHGVQFAAIKVCPHVPDDGCECRKPHPLKLIEAAQELKLDLAASFMIGDTPADVEAGRAAGCRTICIGTEASADHQANDLLAAAGIIGSGTHS